MTLSEQEERWRKEAEEAFPEIHPEPSAYFNSYARAEQKAYILACRSRQKDIEALQKELSDLREENRWIPVTERLPDGPQNVLVVGGRSGMRVNIAWLSSDGESKTWVRLNSGDSTQFVKFWRPLPQTPKQ